MPRTAVYADCFDPPTEASLWLVREGAKLFDRLTVAVLEPTDWPGRESLFSLEERLAFLGKAFSGLDNVCVMPFFRPVADSWVLAAGADYLLNDQSQSCPWGSRREFAEGRGDGSGRSVVIIVPPEVGRFCNGIRHAIGFADWQEDIRADLPPAVWAAFLERTGNPLYARWFDVWKRYIGTPPLPPYRALLSAYREPHRTYHGFEHVRHCLEMFDWARDDFRQPYAAEIALWAHDSVYDPNRQDNEERSADFLNRFGQPPSAVRDLVLETTHRGTPRSPDGALIRDIDLAALAVDQAKFDANSLAIRREYAQVPEMQYRVERAAILRGLLRRPRIYFTERFADRFEDAARANLARAVTLLESEERLA